MKPTVLAAALAAILMSAGVAAQTPAPQAPAAPKAAPKADASKAAPKADAAPAGKQLFPPQQYDFMLKERLAQGAQDTPELRQAVREELNTRELLAREARKQGIDKTADMKAQMDLAAQTVLVRAYVSDWLQKNPIPEAELHKEYDQIKSQIGDKEYKVRHILVDKEDEAKEIIAELQKGAKFEDLAKAPVAYIAKDAQFSWWQWLKADYGFKDESLRPYNYNVGPFLADKHSLQQGYAVEEPITIAKEGGFKPAVFLLADHGYSTYSTTIEARTETVRTRPDLVKRFVEASILGWVN